MSENLLIDELTNDPLARGYAGMTDQQRWDSLNTVIDRVRPKQRPLSGDDVFQATESSEWQALTDLNKQLWLSFCSRQQIDAYGAANVALVTNLFGGGSTTISNLQDLRSETVSRAEELAIDVTIGALERARLKMGG